MAKTMEDNIAFLTEAKEAVLQLESARAAQAELDLTEKKQAKTLAAEKKAVEDHVNNTIKKRRDELAGRYDSEISKVQDAIKKVKSKREKAKQQGIKERIAAQIAPFQAENKEMKDKIKTMLKQNHVPGFCNSTLFYALYFTRTVKEVVVMLLTFAICCVGIPCGIFWLLPQHKTWQLVLIYLAVIIVFGGIYIMIGNFTKDAHRAVLQEVGQIRRAIDKNRKKMRSVSRRIRREKSEEHYDLSSFDSELAQKEKEKSDLMAKKEEAMACFISTTKSDITEEIVSGSRERIEKLEEEHNRTVDALSEKASFVKSVSFKLTNDYEAYIGKEFMQADKLDALKQILQDGQAATITEAGALYREKNAGRK